MKMITLGLWRYITTGVLACGIALGWPLLASQAEPFTAIDAATQNQALGRGVNVLGYDPLWQTPAKARFTPSHFKLIHDAGFQHVRIVLFSFDFIDAQGKIDPQWLATLDTMVKAALDQGLTVILDEHDFLLCAKDVGLCKTKLHAFWSQIAPRYKDAPNRVLFEILNEPNGALTDELWNGLLRDTLALIRTTNPERNVIIGGSHWNGFDSLQTLALPAAHHCDIPLLPADALHPSRRAMG
jgi:endoglucanase